MYIRKIDPLLKNYFYHIDIDYTESLKNNYHSTRDKYRMSLKNVILIKSFVQFGLFVRLLFPKRAISFVIFLRIVLETSKYGIIKDII